MSRTRYRLFTLLPAFLLLLNDALRTYVRPRYRTPDSCWVGTTLGWLPNFLAPLAFLGMGAVALRFFQDLKGQALRRRHRRTYVLLVAAVALVGFLQHEFAQKSNGLVYDDNDVFATFAGVLIGVLLFRFVPEHAWFSAEVGEGIREKRNGSLRHSTPKSPAKPTQQRPG